MPRKIKWGLVGFLWATVGAAWFILFQILGFLSEEASITIITLFGLYMYLIVFCSAALVAWPTLHMLAAKFQGKANLPNFSFNKDKEEVNG